MPPMNEQFQIWSILHFSILIITAVIMIVLVSIARKKENTALPRRIGYTLAVILSLNSAIYIFYRIYSGFWEIRYDLPMEFCNWSMFFTTVALINHNKIMAELSYYWVMAGSVHAIFTPDLQVTFPHIYFFLFFVAHSGLVISSLYVVFGLRLYPGKRSVSRAFIILQFYFISAFMADKILVSNYGYMMAKPTSRSVLNFLWEWPYYLIQMQIIFIALFIILYLPFYLSDRKKVSRK